MKTNSPTPKIAALLEQITSGKMQSDKARILNFIMSYPGHSKVVIGKHLDLRHQTVTARLSDLEDLGLIEAKGSGKYSNFYYIQDTQGQKLHRAKRAADKLEAWAKKGIQLGVNPIIVTSIRNYVNGK